MNSPYTTPEYKKTSFNCPYCNAYASQVWHYAASSTYYGNYQNSNVDDVDFCFCSHCKKYSIWYEEIMLYPDSVGVESPNEDLDDSIVADYNEAVSILHKSPRGAAALLRLALQKLCKQLGEPGKDINADIGNLVSKGLSPTIQQALDALRVIGNEAVHPGELNLKDDLATATALFHLLNKIAETMITEPRQIQEIYDKIPTSKKKGIENRDKGQVKK